MASGSRNRVQYGVFVGPLRCSDVHPSDLARRVYILLTNAGFTSENIDTISLHTGMGFARVGLWEIDCENKIVQRCRDYRYLMSIFDLYQLTLKPQQFRVIRLQPYNEEFMTLNDFWRKITTNVSKHKYAVIYDPHIDDRSAALKQTEAQPKPPEKVQASTEITKSFTRLPKSLPEVQEDKPIMISAKTSTTVIEPCFFPHRRFFLESEIPQLTDKNHVFLTDDRCLDNLRHFRKTLAKYMCAFLNSEGGSIYFGFNASGQVVGLEINYKFEDTLTLDIDNVIKSIIPDVPISAYHVTFTRIINARGHEEPDLKVLEVKVQGLMPDEYKYTHCGAAYIWADNSVQKLDNYTVSDKQVPNTCSCKSSNKGGHDNRGGTRQGNKGSANQCGSSGNREGSRQERGGKGGSSKQDSRGSRKYGYSRGGFW